MLQLVRYIWYVIEYDCSFFIILLERRVEIIFSFFSTVEQYVLCSIFYRWYCITYMYCFNFGFVWLNKLPCVISHWSHNKITILNNRWHVWTAICVFNIRRLIQTKLTNSLTHKQLPVLQNFISKKCSMGITSRIHKQLKFCIVTRGEIVHGLMK